MSNLKAFIKYDKKGNVVPGSVVLRDNKPENGNWIEIVKEECCGPLQTPIPVSIESSYPIYSPDITISNTITILGPSINVADITELATTLNTNKAKVLGNFTVVDGILYLTPNFAIASFFKSIGKTSLNAYVYPD